MEQYTNFSVRTISSDHYLLCVIYSFSACWTEEMKVKLLPDRWMKQFATHFERKLWENLLQSSNAPLFAPLRSAGQTHNSATNHPNFPFQAQVGAVWLRVSLERVTDFSCRLRITSNFHFAPSFVTRDVLSALKWFLNGLNSVANHFKIHIAPRVHWQEASSCEKPGRSRMKRGLRMRSGHYLPLESCTRSGLT